MDSRLLNVFHDDPFDGNYVSSTDYWTDNSETMELQLTETLHGILPIGPTDDVSDIYHSAMLKDDLQLEHKDDAACKTQTNKALFFDDFVGQHVSVGDAIEIITVDPNAACYDSDDAAGDVIEYLENDEHDFEDEFEGDDARSQRSTSTFRTRTDSSSIGDYESHSSDYDDDEDEVMHTNYQHLNMPVLQKLACDEIDLHTAGLFTADNFLFDHSMKSSLQNMTVKNRTFSTNTVGSDVDGLGLHIDSNAFDLADFITKDDFALTATPTAETVKRTSNAGLSQQKGTTIAKQVNKLVEQVIISKRNESDSDSDVIVDVETVEVDAEAETLLWSRSTIATQTANEQVDDVPYVDNVKADPSWNPDLKKADTQCKESKSQAVNGIAPQNFGRSFSIVPSKKQCDFLKGKYGRSKLPRNGKCAEKAAEKPKPAVRKVGIGQGGKNLALIQHTIKQEQSSEAEMSSPIKTTSQEVATIAPPVVAPVVAPPAVKRKLNLEEYKKRRSDNVGLCGHVANKILKPIEGQLQQKSNPIPMSTAPAPVPIKHSEAVTSIVKTLKEQASQPKAPASDPITEAKNKVLRMQELRRAQQLKIIDSAVSAKVPRVTKLPPLKEIVKGSYLKEEKTPTTVLKTHPDYEEIIIVSVGSNTDITMPPTGTQPHPSSSRSLLKSNELLSNMSNTFQKVQSAESIKISNSSLIVSIQNVVVKSATAATSACMAATAQQKPAVTTGDQPPPQHGEDKIIMHLRKDRMRNRTATIATQTELQPAFPPLPLPPQRRSKARRNYRKRSSGDTTLVHHSTDESDVDARDGSSARRCSPSATAMPSYRSRSRSNDSCTSSVDRLRVDAAGGYSSRSSRRHRSSISSSYSESERVSRSRQRKSSYKQRAKKHVRSSSASSEDYSSRSCSRSRTRSRSPRYLRRSRSRSMRRRGNPCNNSFVDRNVSQPAVEERRIVYVGRIEQETTKEMLRRKFLAYGSIKQITIHYKENGMKYGFVTYESSKDAFTVIDSSARDPHINMYDISFGGRRAFCRASYADLDNAGINTYHSVVFPKVAAPPQEDSFEALLQKVKAKMHANKPANAPATEPLPATSNGTSTNKT